jgi:hypothetical protein
MDPKPTTVIPTYVPRVLSMGGIIFLGAAFLSIFGIVMMMVMETTMGQTSRGIDLSGVANMADLLGRYLSAFAAPTLLLLVAVISSVTGYLLLRAAGAATKEVIPEEDRPLLEKMLLQSPERGIEQYIRLSSLSGVSGFFTKIGLSGLPLATIALTLIFTVLSIWDDSFSELAKLTLGVFLGSYVQRHAEMQQQTRGGPEI